MGEIVHFCSLTNRRQILFSIHCYAIPRVGELLYLHDETVCYRVKLVSHNIFETHGELHQAVNVLVEEVPLPLSQPE